MPCTSDLTVLQKHILERINKNIDTRVVPGIWLLSALLDRNDRGNITKYAVLVTVPVRLYHFPSWLTRSTCNWDFFFSSAKGFCGVEKQWLAQITYTQCFSSGYRVFHSNIFLKAEKVYWFDQHPLRWKWRVLWKYEVPAALKIIISKVLHRPVYVLQ